MARRKKKVIIQIVVNDDQYDSHFKLGFSD